MVKKEISEKSYFRWLYMINHNKPYLIAEILLLRKVPWSVIKEITEICEEELEFLLRKNGLQEEY
jgi:hypothetical protein